MRMVQDIKGNFDELKTHTAPEAKGEILTKTLDFRENEMIHCRYSPISAVLAQTRAPNFIL